MIHTRLSLSHMSFFRLRKQSERVVTLWENDLHTSILFLNFQKTYICWNKFSKIYQPSLFLPSSRRLLWLCFTLVSFLTALSFRSGHRIEWVSMNDCKRVWEGKSRSRKPSPCMLGVRACTLSVRGRTFIGHLSLIRGAYAAWIENPKLWSCTLFKPSYKL